MKHALRNIQLVVVAGALLHGGRALHADTGQIREVATGDGIRAIIFTAPTPLRAGLVEVAVVATDESTGKPLPEFEIEVSLRRPDWPAEWPSMVIGGALDPTDRLARKAAIEVQEEGPWDLQVLIRADDRVLEVPLSVEVGAALPRWWQILPIALSGVPILLLVVVRDRLVQGRENPHRGYGRDQMDAGTSRKTGRPDTRGP